MCFTTSGFYQRWLRVILHSLTPGNKSEMLSYMTGEDGDVVHLKA